MWKMLTSLALVAAVAAFVLLAMALTMLKEQNAQLQTLSDQVHQLENQQNVQRLHNAAQPERQQMADFGQQLEADIQAKLPEVQQNVEQGLQIAREGVRAMLRVMESSSPTLAAIAENISQTRTELATELPKLEAEIKKLFQHTQGALQNSSVERMNEEER